MDSGQTTNTNNANWV